MKSLVFATALAVVSIVGAAQTAKAAAPGCVSTTDAQRRAEIGSQRYGGMALRLDGEDAERFLDYLNNKVGHHTEYWGEGVIIGRYPALGYDAVAIVEDGCVDEQKLIRLNPATTDLAYQAARNPTY
ncbi:MAG: hypothetical protein JO273_07260 [Methylobacteriaceae bacterium]|nr:hypothetical protein [Methylobacteriaceae bacterium]MBV9633641.1 hypothetical protein [Methylobacteriaceae bacterium]